MRLQELPTPQKLRFSFLSSVQSLLRLVLEGLDLGQDRMGVQTCTFSARNVGFQAQKRVFHHRDCGFRDFGSYFGRNLLFSDAGVQESPVTPHESAKEA